MCRQYLTLYSWCQCEQDAGYQACSTRKQNSCAGISVETVHMQCFCNLHATKGFTTEKQSQKKMKKKNNRSSRLSQSSESSRDSRYSDSSLEEKASQTPSLRRRWFRMWSRSL